MGLLRLAHRAIWFMTSMVGAGVRELWYWAGTTDRGFYMRGSKRVEKGGVATMLRFYVQTSPSFFGYCELS